MIVRKFKAILQSINYLPGSFQIVQRVKKGRKPNSSRGVVGRSRGHGNGEVIELAKFLVSVDLGVLDDHFDRWPPAIDIINELHVKWSRLTENRHMALRATQPTSLEVEAHCDNDGNYRYTISQSSINKWVSEAELYLAQHK